MAKTNMWTYLDGYEPIIKQVGDNLQITGGTITWNSKYGNRTPHWLFNEIAHYGYRSGDAYYWNSARTPGYCRIDLTEPTHVDAIVWWMNRNGEYNTVRIFDGDTKVWEQTFMGNTNDFHVEYIDPPVNCTYFTMNLSGASWYSWTTLLIYTKIYRRFGLVEDLPSGVIKTSYGGGFIPIL